MRKIKFCSGLTLLEVMISISIFLMLMSALFYIYVVSTRSWLKVRQKIEVKDSAQITLTRIEREIRSTAIGSIDIQIYPVSTVNQAISFLSSYNDSKGITDYDDSSGKMLWNRYVIFYLRDDDKVARDGFYKLCRKEVSIKTLSVNNRTTKPLYQLPYAPLDATPPTQNHVMTDYIDLNGTGSPYVGPEKTITRNITRMGFTSYPSTKKVEITVYTGKTVDPKNSSSPVSPEKLELIGAVVLRNSN